MTRTLGNFGNSCPSRVVLPATLSERPERKGCATTDLRGTISYEQINCKVAVGLCSSKMDCKTRSRQRQQRQFEATSGRGCPTGQSLSAVTHRPCGSWIAQVLLGKERAWQSGNSSFHRLFLYTSMPLFTITVAFTTGSLKKYAQLDQY